MQKFRRSVLAIFRHLFDLQWASIVFSNSLFGFFVSLFLFLSLFLLFLTKAVLRKPTKHDWLRLSCEDTLNLLSKKSHTKNSIWHICLQLRCPDECVFIQKTMKPVLRNTDRKSVVSRAKTMTGVHLEALCVYWSLFGVNWFPHGPSILFYFSSSYRINKRPC